ncbi:MAG: Asp-tRNA(Asn)/Glu-tRNA(Gln) amidotransferase subunit GatA [Phycisphaeraceae bacterium]|nr:Asp-tRNA(Asn)/Glu-tRNA(Gln) amidotransferase subunit GatA [Phycisphaeraceae bacterium]
MTPPPSDPAPPPPSAALLAARIRAGELTAVAATQHTLAQLDALGPALNCFIDTFPEESLARAAAIDKARADGAPLGPLAGVPIALKDNMCLSWGRTTCASKMLADYRSPYTLTVGQRLIDAGAIIVGKTNMDEFAMGSSGESSCFGPTRNPHDHTRVPGGSSSGSAAAVAAGIVPVALGSDTGGSIRQPAGLSGIVGMKPTYGRVSRYGLVAYASSLDQIGPLARTVEDCALLLETICGVDPADGTTADLPAPALLTTLNDPIDRPVIGVPKQAHDPHNHPGVVNALGDAIDTFVRMGARIVEVDLAHVAHGIAAYYLVASAEASSNLARFDGVRYGHRATLQPGDGLLDLYCKSRSEGFGSEVQRRIMLGTHALSSGYADAYYNTALKVRRLIRRDYDAAFAPNDKMGTPACDAILMPSSPSPAFKIGEKTADPLAMYLEDVYTVTVNLAGLPAITLPGTPTTVEGVSLPVGMQLIGRAFDEPRLLRIARMLELACGNRP